MTSRTRIIVAFAVVLVVATGAGVWLFTSRGAETDPPGSQVSTGTAKVQRTDVAERFELSGTLGHAGSYNVIAAGPGTLTRLPAAGSVIGLGDSAYEVDGLPVLLLQGARPVWRAMGPGMTDGADVRQLETSLHGLGFAPSLTIDTHFSAATYWAVRRWQSASHLPVTGSVPLGQVVFAPTAVRIEAHDLKVGEQVQPGAVIEHGSGRAAAVTTQLDPAELPTLRVGERVRVTLPDGKVKRGRIATVGAVAQDATPASGGGGGGGGGGSPDEAATVPVTIMIGGRIRGFLDQAQVQVAITRESHKGVLAVPITALRGVVGGGYEVIVVNATTTRHVRVDVGLFDETAGLAEVQGPGLTAGQRVEVPREGA